MRFCDKLPKLRKNNNLSQEQLAEKVGVSRQAVSKWESGTSYPDMDKLLQICKILNCTLDDLLDDGSISPNQIQSKKEDSNNYLQDFLNYITKLLNMFLSMNWKERISCLIEMLFHVGWMLGISFLCIHFLLTLSNSFIRVFFPYSYRITYFFKFLFLCIFSALDIIIFFHILKVRYLDYYVTIEDQTIKEKTIETEVEQEESKKIRKEKIIIRDPKHSISFFFQALTKLISFFLRLLSFFIAMFLIVLFIITLVVTTVSLSFVPDGIIFLLIAFVLIGIEIFIAIFLSFIYNFIFQKKVAWKGAFFALLSSIILSSISLGLVITTILGFEYIKDSEVKKEKKELEISLEDQSIIYENDCNHIEYVIDDSYPLGKAKLEIVVPEGISYYLNSYHSYNYNGEKEITYYVIDTYPSNSYLLFYRKILEGMKKKQIVNYKQLECVNVQVTLSQETHDRMMQY